MFRVLWRQRAINDLAVIWIQADSTGRRAITEAASTIDRTLQDEPFDSSESRGDEDRVFFAPPLGVLFEVDPHLRIVRIEHVWQYRRPSK